LAGVLKLLIAAAAVILLGLGGLSAARGVPPLGTGQAGPTQTAPTPAAGEQSFEITEAQLTDALSRRLVGRPLGTTPLGTATLQRLNVQLRNNNNQIQADGDAQVGSGSVPVQMTSHVDVRDGRPLVVVSDARAAGVPMPDSTRTSIQQVIQSPLDQELQRRQLRVQSVTVADGKLTVVGRQGS
jgi:hypothetical protein